MFSHAPQPKISAHTLHLTRPSSAGLASQSSFRAASAAGLVAQMLEYYRGSRVEAYEALFRATAQACSAVNSPGPAGAGRNSEGELAHVHIVARQLLRLLGALLVAHAKVCFMSCLVLRCPIVEMQKKKTGEVKEAVQDAAAADHACPAWSRMAALRWGCACWQRKHFILCDQIPKRGAQRVNSCTSRVP